MSDHPIQQRFRDLFRMSDAEASAIIGMAGVSYFREFFSGRVPVDLYLNKVHLIARLVNAKGHRVLDVGCGHGFVSCLLEAEGVSESIGIDIKGSKIEQCGKLVEYLGCSRTKFLEYDGSELPFSDDSLDAVCISAALSHVADIDATLSEMRRVLRRGGTFYCFEDNNDLHWKYRSIMQPVWDYAETGEGKEGHACTGSGWVPYIERRRKMIADWFPDLASERVQPLARATQGLVGDEIRVAVAEHLHGGSDITVNKPFLYYAPDTGEAMEYPFTPPLLRDWAAKHFGNAQIHSAWVGPWGGLKGKVKLGLKAAGSVLPWLAWKTQPTFIVTARKD